MCGKAGYFAKDCRLNVVYRDEILVTIIKQFNITTKEYLIKVLNKGFKPQKEILGILDIEIW